MINRLLFAQCLSGTFFSPETFVFVKPFTHKRSKNLWKKNETSGIMREFLVEFEANCDAILLKKSKVLKKLKFIHRFGDAKR